jgi:hypothetical protein
MSDNCTIDDNLSSDSSETDKLFKTISTWSVKKPSGQTAVKKKVCSKMVKTSRNAMDDISMESSVSDKVPNPRIFNDDISTESSNTKKVKTPRNVKDDVSTESSDTAIIMKRISTRNAKNASPKAVPNVTASSVRRSPRSSTRYQRIKIDNKLKTLKEVKTNYSTLGFHKDSTKSKSFESGSGSDVSTTDAEEDIVDDDY